LTSISQPFLAGYLILQAEKHYPQNLMVAPFLLIMQVDMSTCSIKSLNAGETIMAKRKFECIAALYGVSIQSYHGDNVVFKSAEFKEELTLHQQTMSFSGTGAHHQNGIAECAIQQTTLWARAMLLHALIMWPHKTKIDLWPLALSHAEYLWNHIPKHDSGMSPLDIFSGSSHTMHILRNCKVYGCLVFVLDPRLQDGHKIPKWQPRS